MGSLLFYAFALQPHQIRLRIPISDPILKHHILIPVLCLISQEPAAGSNTAIYPVSQVGIMGYQ